MCQHSITTTKQHDCHEHCSKHHTHTSKCEHKKEPSSVEIKERCNKKIQELLTTSKTNEEIRTNVVEFLNLMNQRNGSDMKITPLLIVVVKQLLLMINEMPKLKALFIKMCMKDGHQNYKTNCFCIYHDGDSLIMHLFMCCLTIGSTMLNDGRIICEKYGRSNLSLIVVKMFEGITHDIGKHFFTFEDSSRNFLGFPLHGQSSGIGLLTLFEPSFRVKYKLTFDECYRMSLVSTFHMDWYHAKSGTANHGEIMALARFFGKDIIESLYYLCIADNLAKITKDGVPDRKFPTYDSLKTHALEFKDTISAPITMSEMKDIITVEQKGVLVFIINGFDESSIVLPDSVTSHENIVIISDDSEMETIEENLKQGKIVLINSSITSKKELARYITFGNSYLKINLIYSSGLEKDTFNPLPQITHNQKISGMRTLKELCSLYAKPSRDLEMKAIQPHVSLPVCDISSSFNYFLDIISNN